MWSQGMSGWWMLRMPSEFIVHTLENATSESKICLCSVVGHSQTPQKAKPKVQPVERDAWQPLSISIRKLIFLKASYCWWKKSCTSWSWQFIPLLIGFYTSQVPGGYIAGCLPSTVRAWMHEIRLHSISPLSQLLMLLRLRQFRRWHQIGCDPYHVGDGHMLDLTHQELLLVAGHIWRKENLGGPKVGPIKHIIKQRCSFSR